MKLSVTLAALLAAFAVSNVESYTNPIMIKGYRMFDAKTNASFAVKGIDYYPRPNAGTLDDNNIDLFTDDHYDVWKDDIELLAATGANAVRLYAVDPSKSHDKFMCALRAKGMYALVDLAASCPNCAITKDAYPACYPAALEARGEQIILAFAKYDNVLAFSAGNEVNQVVGADATVNAPCQKKFIRDMRAFIGTCSSIRKIPVGVVLADPNLDKNNRELNAKYYNCLTDPTDKYENAEWYGLNAYQYYAQSFLQLQTDFASYKMTIPVMLTEYGCLNKGFPTEKGYEAQRTWLQAGWLYSSDFRKVFSGGFVFEYSTENGNSKLSDPASGFPFTSYGPQNYGLGYFSPANCDHNTTKCTYVPMPNYDNLATQYKAVSISSETTLQSFTCSGQQSSGTWATGSGSGTVGGTPTGSSSSGSGSSSTSTGNVTATPSGAPTLQMSLVASVVSFTTLSAILGAFF
uniref:Glycoside hydrolase family 5 domain-containing protein n=1 Tax=Phytophthora ramorum TaxID=164328 RepID=H3HBS7_PHYRM